VPSDEVSAPESGQEVVEESARGVQTVDAARFNGLMGRFNRTQSELEQARQRIAELEATRQGATEDSVTDTSALESQVAALQSMLMEERLDKARAQAVQEFPGAKAFADLIIADSPEAIREMAQLLHERVGQAAPADPAAAAAGDDAGNPEPAPESAPAVAAPAAPQVAGGTSISDAPVDAQERVVDAIKRRSFSDYLRAKSEQMHAASGELVL
jgi:hypothetical protein